VGVGPRPVSSAQLSPRRRSPVNEKKAWSGFRRRGGARLEAHAHGPGGPLTVLEAIRQHAERERLDLGEGDLGALPVGEDAREFDHVGKEAAVVLLLGAAGSTPDPQFAATKPQRSR
jgi:hypothetical protein